MRPTLAASLVTAAALAGCLSAPTGRPPGDGDAATDASAGDATDAAANAWPPAGTDVIAIAAGDLDVDGEDDLIVADEEHARIYLLRGGVDLVPGSAVTTFSASATLTGLRRPASVAVVRAGSVRHVVVLDSPTAGARVTVLSAALAPTGTSMLSPTAPMPGDTVRVYQSTFGMMMDAVMVSVPDQAGFIEGSRLDDPAPQILMVVQTGVTFTDLLLVGGYVPGGNPPGLPRIVALESTRTHRADVMQGNYTWTLARDGAAWSSQTFHEVTGDAFLDVVAFVPDGANPADVCVADFHDATVPSPTYCYDTPFTMNDGEILVGPLASPTSDDAVVLHHMPGGDASLFLVRNLRVSGAALLADGGGPPYELTMQEPARHVIMQLDTAMPEVVVVGADGAIACARTSGASFAACAP